MKPYALIFELDGTLADSQTRHSQIVAELLYTAGVFITPNEITRRFSGVNTGEFCTELLMKHANLPRDDAERIAQGIAREKWARLQDPSVLHDIKRIDGAYTLLDRLSQHRIPMAIGSASIREYCSLLLAELRMERFFSHIVGGDMVARGKPAPDLFLLTSHLLATPPERCIVVGDSVHDFHGAKNAGMHSIALRPHGKVRGEYLHGAYPIAHLREITKKLLESLVISAH